MCVYFSCARRYCVYNKGMTNNETLTKGETMKTTKHEFGYLCNGFLIEKMNGEWVISEMTEGGWIPVDQFSTKKRCVEMIKYWATL